MCLLYESKAFPRNWLSNTVHVPFHLAHAHENTENTTTNTVAAARALSDSTDPMSLLIMAARQLAGRRPL